MTCSTSATIEGIVRPHSKLYLVAFPTANWMGVAKYLFQDDFGSASDLAAQLLQSASVFFFIKRAGGTPN
jgi:hypothetical protein